MITEQSIYTLLEAVRPIRILLVEPEMTEQFIVAKNLGSLGNKLDICNSAEEAIRRSTMNAYDLIIVDLNLPVQNGFELSESLKEASRQCGATPKIIGLSASNHPLIPIMLEFSDVDDFVVRTADYRELKSKIFNLCYLSQN